jgi:hypothetical protein
LGIIASIALEFKESGGALKRIPAPIASFAAIVPIKYLYLMFECPVLKP